MNIKFKSEEHRQQFAKLFKCNEWIARTMGLDTWECQIENDDDHESAIAVLDGFGNQIEGTFTDPGGNASIDYAWIFYNERDYFDIKY